MLSKIHDECMKNVTGDLVFDSKWPSFELDLELIKTNILSKIHDDCSKNMIARSLEW